MKTTSSLQPHPGWTILFFVVLGPPIGGFLFTLATAGIFAFSPLAIMAALLSYALGLWPAGGAALLFWIACFLYRRMRRVPFIDLKAGAALGLLSGFVSMSVFIVAIGPYGTVGGFLAVTLLGAFVSAICGLLSIRFSNSSSAGVPCSPRS